MVSEYPEPGSAQYSDIYNYPLNYDPKYEVSTVQAATVQRTVDDNWVEAAQAGASALGGAGVALGGRWLYRRRHVRAA